MVQFVIDDLGPELASFLEIRCPLNDHLAPERHHAACRRRRGEGHAPVARCAGAGHDKAGTLQDIPDINLQSLRFHDRKGDR